MEKLHIIRSDEAETMPLLIFKKEVMEIVKSVYGTIYLIELETGEKMILKKYNSDKGSDKITEGLIMKNLSRYLPVAGIYDIIYNDGTYFLLMPYYKHSLSSMQPIVSQIKNVLYQLLYFAKNLTSNGIIHRDLKPGNILIDDNGYIKVIDFGLSCYQHIDLNNNVVTIWYRAPEILNGKRYNYKSDLWSIGCTIAQIILGYPLFCENKEADMIDKIQQFDKHRERFKKETNQLIKSGKTMADYRPNWKYLKDLKKIYVFSSEIFAILMNLLEINPQKRKSAALLLRNSLFDEFDDLIPSHKKTLIDLTDDNICRYRIYVRGLSIDQIKYKPKMSNQYQLERSDNLYITYDSSSHSRELIYEIYNGHRAEITLHCVSNLLIMESPVVDMQLDIVTQSMHIFTKLLTIIKDPTNKLIARKIAYLIDYNGKNKVADAIVEHQMTYLNQDRLIYSREQLITLFNLCYIISHEIISDRYKTDKKLNIDLEQEKYHYIMQLIIDLFNYEIKQNRRFFHSSNNLDNFNTYNVVYNLLYILEPSIWEFQYNYVVAHLQWMKHGNKRKILKSMKTDEKIITIINNFISQGWSQIKDRLSKYVPVDTLNKCERFYFVYRKKYVKNNKIVN